MREMKDSGIEWIGAMPQAWKMNTIAQIFLQVKCKNTGLQEKNLLSLSYGKVKRKSIDTVEGLLPESFDGYNIIEKGDIVLRLTDLQNDHTSLRVGLAEERGIITSAYLTIRNRSNFCPKYLYYYLHSFDIAKGFYGMGAGVRQGLNWDGVKWLKILAPSVPEQERIAAFLDAECAEIDAVLEKTRASIEEYKKLKQAVITQAVTKGIFDKQIYPHNVKLKYLLYIASGDAIRNEELSEVGKYPAYGGGESLGFASKYNTLENSLIVGRVGARCGCVTYIDSKAWATDNALIVHPICNPRYMYYMLIYSQLNNLNTSNAQPLITATKIKNVVVPYFLEDICQRKIVDFLDEKCACIDAIIEKKQQYLAEIENYKKSLIYEYVTGKREV